MAETRGCIVGSVDGANWLLSSYAVPCICVIGGINCTLHANAVLGIVESGRWAGGANSVDFQGSIRRASTAGVSDLIIDSSVRA